MYFYFTREIKKITHRWVISGAVIYDIIPPAETEDRSSVSTSTPLEWTNAGGFSYFNLSKDKFSLLTL